MRGGGPPAAEDGGRARSSDTGGSTEAQREAHPWGGRERKRVIRENRQKEERLGNAATSMVDKI